MAAILSPKTSVSAEWWLAAEGSAGNIFVVDRATISSRSMLGRTASFAWEQVLVQDDQGTYYLKESNLLAYDCRQRASALAASRDYDANGQITDSYDWPDYRLDFKYVAPGTVGDAKLNFVCNSHRGSGDVTEFVVEGFEYLWLSSVELFLEALNTPEESAPKPALPENQIESSVESSGTLFFVNEAGVAITSAHVVAECSQLMSSRWGAVAVTARDEAADLALLKVATGPLVHARVRQRGPRLAEPVTVAGYPLSSLLGTGIRLTTGTISALAGVGGDRTYVQISAPIQPGNSGGPVLDESGEVIGVVAAKLDEIRFAAATGGLPQNVNFAVSGAVLQSFLDENGISASAASAKNALPQEYTFELRCIR